MQTVDMSPAPAAGTYRRSADKVHVQRQISRRSRAESSRGNPGPGPGPGGRSGFGGGVSGHAAAFMEIPCSLVMPPGRHQFAPQSLGWARVCGSGKSGVWVLKGDARTDNLPWNLDDVGIVWERRSGYETAWATPGHVCSCSYTYGHGPVLPQANPSVCTEAVNLWSRVASLLTPWCAKGEVEAEASLSRAYLAAGGPPLSSPGSYVGRGSLSICTMRLGGRCHDRIHRTDRADEFDVAHSGFFLNSSLALRFRRSFVSVCNVLKGIKLRGFSESRISALEYRWQAVVRLGPTGPVTSLEPWTHWIVLKVVRHRQSSRCQAWSNWIREDLTSRPYQWLRPEFVPPAPYLVCKPLDSPNGSGLLVQPALIDAHFRKAWMPYFRREGHPVVTVQAFLDFVGDHLAQEPFLDLPILTGEDLYEAAMAKKSTAGGLDGWAWNEIKALSLSWFVVLALVLRQIETTGQWPQGLRDAYIAMIPKAEGDSTPLGQRPLCVLPVVYRLWASVRLAHLGVPRLMPGMPLLLTLKRFLVMLVTLAFISSLLMLLSLLTPLTAICLIVPLAGLVFLPGFVRCTSLFIVMFVFGLSLQLVLALLGSEMGAFLKDAP